MRSRCATWVAVPCRSRRPQATGEGYQRGARRPESSVGRTPQRGQRGPADGREERQPVADAVALVDEVARSVEERDVVAVAAGRDDQGEQRAHHGEAEEGEHRGTHRNRERQRDAEEPGHQQGGAGQCQDGAEPADPTAACSPVTGPSFARRLARVSSSPGAAPSRMESNQSTTRRRLHWG